jgi:hypothetical protein
MCLAMSRNTTATNAKSMENVDSSMIPTWGLFSKGIMMAEN